MDDVIDLAAFRRRAEASKDWEALALIDRVAVLEATADELRDRFESLVIDLRDQKRISIRVVDRAKALEEEAHEALIEIEEARPRGRAWVYFIGFLAGMFAHWLLGVLS